MTPEQIQIMANGLPPLSIGKDYEEVITWLANQHIALQQQVNALAAENLVARNIIDSVSDPDNEPHYHDEGMGCGLEDRGITDCYEAMGYGWDSAMERFYCEVIPSRDELNFPATDAVQNEWMAKGVDAFGVYHNFSDKQLAQVAAKEFAAKLRAGDKS